MGVMRNAFKILIGSLEGKSYPEDLGIDGNNIRMGLRAIGWESEDWMQLAQDRGKWRAVVNTVMNLRVHKRRGIS